MGNEYFEPYSVNEYKGLKYGERYSIQGKEYMIYRLDDKRNEVTLIAKHCGFKYMNIDEFLNWIDKKAT